MLATSNLHCSLKKIQTSKQMYSDRMVSPLESVVDVNTNPPVYFFESVYLCRNMYHSAYYIFRVFSFVSRTGNSIQKATRFRVGVQGAGAPPRLERIHGCNTLVAPMLEKGLVTTFKTVY